ncbi:MAG: ABC transporter permease [Candidatus Zixiibacteriota bacterium]
MKAKRVKAVAKKEFYQIRRDLRSLILAFALPSLLMLLFGYAITLDIKDIPIAFWDQDHTQKSKEFIRKFEESRYFEVKEEVDNYQKLQKLLDKGRIKIGLVIPAGFAEGIYSGEEVQIQTLLDGSDGNTGTIGLGYVSGLTSSYTLNVLQEEKKFLSLKPPLDYRVRVWYNPDLKSTNFIIPGLIAAIIMIVAALLTSLTFAREWERGTMEQLLSTPVKPLELIFGKFIPYFVIGAIDVVMVLLLGTFLFKVPLRGDILLLSGVCLIYLIGATGLGILISVLTKSQLLANQIGWLATFLPTFLLSGFIFPIFNMPKPIQAITYLVPARYFIKILRDIFLKGNGIICFYWEVIFLLLFCLAMFFLAVSSFKKRMK